MRINNFKVYSIADADCGEYFGFTDDEVREMLSYYQLEPLYGTVKEWYDGYRFGNANVYCPWDVVCYVDEHRRNVDAPPKMYWLNTSGNFIIKKLIKRADAVMKAEIEQLMEGQGITKEIKMELTYHDLDEPEDGDLDTSRENLWSMLYITGYLTVAEPSRDARHYHLMIPNQEIHDIFVTQVKAWIKDTLIWGNTSRLRQFCGAVKNGDAKAFQEKFNAYLEDTISIRDTSVAKPLNENFYHGLLVGLLRGEGSWVTRSNQESGNGYTDILVEGRAEKVGCVFEIKYAENGTFEAACMEAMRQIEEKDYVALLRQEGMRIIHIYGVACFKKGCKVVYKKWVA